MLGDTAPENRARCSLGEIATGNRALFARRNNARKQFYITNSFTPHAAVRYVERAAKRKRPSLICYRLRATHLLTELESNLRAWLTLHLQVMLVSRKYSQVFCCAKRGKAGESWMDAWAAGGSGRRAPRAVYDLDTPESAGEEVDGAEQYKDQLGDAHSRKAHIEPFGDDTAHMFDRFNL